MARTIIATVFVTESGDVKSLNFIDDRDYRLHTVTSTFGAPYLGEYESSEDWRAALGQWLMEYSQEYFGIGLKGPQGDHLAYVSPKCSAYVYELDFDS